MQNSRYTTGISAVKQMEGNEHRLCSLPLNLNRWKPHLPYTNHTLRVVHSREIFRAKENKKKIIIPSPELARRKKCTLFLQFFFSSPHKVDFENFIERIWSDVVNFPFTLFNEHISTALKIINSFR